MDHKGYIKKIKEEPLPKKGGRRKSYFKIAPVGIRALKDAIELHKRIWKDINKYSFDES